MAGPRKKKRRKSAKGGASSSLASGPKSLIQRDTVGHVTVPDGTDVADTHGPDIPDASVDGGVVGCDAGVPPQVAGEVQVDADAQPQKTDDCENDDAKSIGTATTLVLPAVSRDGSVGIPKHVDPSTIVVDENPYDDGRLENIQKRFVARDLAVQQGVEMSPDGVVTLPGRMSLSLFVSILVLITAVGFLCGFVYFGAAIPRYIPSLVAVVGVYAAQILVYYTSHRVRRTAICAITILFTLAFGAYVSWAYVDLILYPQVSGAPSKWLGTAAGCFLFVPVLMLTHLAFLGRGYRQISFIGQE